MKNICSQKNNIDWYLNSINSIEDHCQDNYLAQVSNVKSDECLKCEYKIKHTYFISKIKMSII